ncbi:phosphoribosyltransferase [Cellulomonas endometrii]|uniref:phosphoribosyltransferase n=1 Tax=Cellulomonas endometrii TaxID=3036301 RepID=UPI0024ACB45F|nr:phosphoribosyltransferase family protein [Cellulomonas endometrii]
MAVSQPFADRAQAGAALAGRLAAYAGRPGVLVLALPRGGVPVAAPVAAALGAPLDVVVVRKLGLPGHPELAMGALAGLGGEVDVVLNERVLRAGHVRPADLDAVRTAELAELRRREAAFRRDLPALPVTGRTVLVVDDGAATGATVRAAVAALRRHGAAWVVVGLPVCPPDTAAVLAREADELVCVRVPRRFQAVGLEYRDFEPPADADVTALLRAGRPS